MIFIVMFVWGLAVGVAVGNYGDDNGWSLGRKALVSVAISVSGAIIFSLIAQGLSK